MCFYDVALWKYHNVTTVNRQRLAYNKCIKIFFGFSRCYSITHMLLELGLAAIDFVVRGIVVTTN